MQSQLFLLIYISSVIAMKYDGGVVIAADTLGSYGSLARFTEIERVIKVNETTMVGAGGDFADFQFLSDIIRQKQIDEECADDGFSLKPKVRESFLFIQFLYRTCYRLCTAG